MAKLKPGQAVVFKGAAAIIIDVGKRNTDTRGKTTFRWVKLATHKGDVRIPSDHPELHTP